MAKPVRPIDKKAASKKPTYTGAPGEPTPMTLKKKYRGPMILDRCWEYPGAKNKKGYGLGGQAGMLHHRYVYEAVYGVIPEGLQLDHTCENTWCFNPTHLEPVTNDENMRRRADRKTVCSKGHPWIPENIYTNGVRGWCLTCRRANHRERQREYRARKKEASLVAVD